MCVAKNVDNVLSVLDKFVNYNLVILKQRFKKNNNIYTIVTKIAKSNQEIGSFLFQLQKQITIIISIISQTNSYAHEEVPYRILLQLSPDFTSFCAFFFPTFLKE